MYWRFSLVTHPQHNDSLTHLSESSLLVLTVLLENCSDLVKCLKCKSVWCETCHSRVRVIFNGTDRKLTTKAFNKKVYYRKWISICGPRHSFTIRVFSLWLKDTFPPPSIIFGQRIKCLYLSLNSRVLVPHFTELWVGVWAMRNFTFHYAWIVRKLWKICVFPPKLTKMLNFNDIQETSCRPEMGVRPDMSVAHEGQQLSARC